MFHYLGHSDARTHACLPAFQRHMQCYIRATRSRWLPPMPTALQCALCPPAYGPAVRGSAHLPIRFCSARSAHLSMVLQCALCPPAYGPAVRALPTCLYGPAVRALPTCLWLCSARSAHLPTARQCACC